MKVIENVTLYRCDHCKKKMQRKNAMIRHEEFCFKNPEMKPACTDCEFIKEVTKTIYFDTGYGEDTRSVRSFTCTKLNKELFPLSALRRGLPSKYPETFEGAELMPSKCDSYKLNLPF